MIWCSYCHQFHYEKHLEDECQHRRFYVVLFVPEVLRF